MADLVEYAYPSYKIDVSEQMFQSNYFPREVIAQNIKTLREIDSALTGSVGQNIELVQHKANQANTGSFYKSGDTLKSDDLNVTWAAEEARLAIEEYRDYKPEHMYTAPNATKVYSRNLAEGWNSFTIWLQNIPHLARTHYFGTDMPSGYAYSKFLLLSQNFRSIWGTFMSPLGERTCIRNNMSTGKSSPSQLGDFTTAQAEGRPGSAWIPRSIRNPLFNDEQNGMCLKNVGEVFPVTDSRRPEITDGTFAGVDKGMQIFQKVAFFNKHSYVRKADRFHVVRSPELKSESPKCEALDDMTKVNTAYFESNVKKARSGGENTFEVFPLFKGCWNFKGVGDSFWKTGSCPTDLGGAGGYFEYNVSGKLESDTLRLY